MTPRESLAVAVMLSTNYDERMMARADQEMERATTDPGHLAYWREYYEQDAQRVGAKRALWLDVHG